MLSSSHPHTHHGNAASLPDPLEALRQAQISREIVAPFEYFSALDLPDVQGGFEVDEQGSELTQDSSTMGVSRCPCRTRPVTTRGLDR